MADRRLLSALGLSILVHALVAGSPGWRLPFLDEPEPAGLLEARLAPKPVLRPEPAPAPSAPTPPATQPRKPRAKPEIPAPPPPQVAAETAPAGVAETAAPEAPVQPVAATPAKAEIAWPRQGRIRFEITRGEGDQTTLVGQSTHTWRHDGETYAVQTVTETVGLAALFRPVKIVQLSEGRLGTEGIVPQEFRVERSRDKETERARFDWEKMKVTIYAGERIRREATLAAGTQDILSQIYQMGLTGTAARVEMMIATGKGYGRYAYELVGEEKLATRFGEQRTWHVKTPAPPGEQAMELWLAPDYRNLPLRIRFTDRKGEIFDQHAVELEADGARLETKE